MKILGIDPGTATTGYGLIEKNGKGVILLDFGWIKTDKETERGERLKEIYNQTLKIIKEFNPDILAIERLFFYSNAKTAIAVGQAQGVILLAASKQHVRVYDYPPAQVKLTVAGNGRADKISMKRAIRKLFNVRSPNKKKTHFDDVADAIAVAVCHVRQNGG